MSSDDQDDLDFERAEFEAPEGQAAQADPGAASTGPVGMSCVACGRAIHDAYFTRNNQFVCTSCEAPVRAAGPPGAEITRFLGALGLGLVAAAVASVLWMVVTEFTGYEIGLIAIAVGWIVGVAITMGSRCAIGARRTRSGPVSTTALSVASTRAQAARAPGSTIVSPSAPRPARASAPWRRGGSRRPVPRPAP